jgi:hypothetical protein
MRLWPNKSPEPTAVGAGRSAVASVKPRGTTPLTGFTSRVGGGSAFYVRQHYTLMKNITSRKFMLGLLWTLFGVLAFGFGYFNVVRKDWSLPVAIFLGLVYGFIGLWIVRRSGRNSRQAKK